MSLQPWRELSIDTWEEHGTEPRGKREKVWVRSPSGSLWLFKQPKPDRTAEVAIEVFAAKLARAANLSAPLTHACNRHGRRGVLVKSFRRMTKDEFDSGSIVLARLEPNYDANKKELHSVDAVGRALATLEQGYTGAALRVDFAHMLAFDAWLGHTDRHPENWGLLWTRQPRGAAPRMRLAPVYDTAACLGSQLEAKGLAKHLALASLDDYIERCQSGFGDGVDQVKQRDVVKQVKRWQEWADCIHAWLQSFRNLLGPATTFLTKGIPSAWLSAGHRQAAIDLLRERLAWLEVEGT